MGPAYLLSVGLLVGRETINVTLLPKTQNSDLPMLMLSRYRKVLAMASSRLSPGHIAAIRHLA